MCRAWRTAASVVTILTCGVGGGACGKVATVDEYAVHEGGMDAKVQPRDAYARDARADHGVDARGGDATRDVRTTDVLPPDSSTGCEVGAVSYAANEVNPGNDCQSCQPTVSRSAWSDMVDGELCGIAGTCQSGTCMTCPSSCTTDSDCESQCPPSGSTFPNCCDSVTALCFTSPSSTCPGPAAPTCASPCTADSECQTLCPTAPSGSTNCCDTAAATCGVWGLPTCPGPSPPVCASTCASDADCRSRCPAAPAGTILCCDTRTYLCAPFPQSACPGTLACADVCLSDAECQTACPPPPSGSVNCCYPETGRCYISPTEPCPE